MKWSELFANILGDKDVEVTNPTGSQDTPQPEPTTTTAIPPVNQPTPTPSTSTENTTTPNLTQEQFDVLNARIKELESANRELALKGAVDTPPAMSPEEIIYDLCVGRSNNGKNSNTNTSERTNR